jgi:hypothetical protein
MARNIHPAPKLWCFAAVASSIQNRIFVATLPSTGISVAMISQIRHAVFRERGFLVR